MIFLTLSTYERVDFICVGTLSSSAQHKFPFSVMIRWYVRVCAMRETIGLLLQLLGIAVWTEVNTESPRCTYYFGPFSSFAEAEQNQAGFIEDIKGEGAKGIAVVVKRCSPDELTIFD
jgi:hypothetical protein